MYVIAKTSSGLSLIAADGTTVNLTLPDGIAAISGRLLRGAALNRFALVTNGLTAPVWIDANNNVYPARLATPAAPTLAAGSGTGYTGTVRAKVQFLIKDAFGNVLGASELSPLSASVTVTNKTIAYTNIVVSPDSMVNARRIYRTATNGTEFFWDFDIDNNTTTTAENAHTDASLDLVAVDSGDYVAAPSALDMAIAHQDRVWGRASDDPDTLQGSQIDDVTSWPIQIPTYPVGAERSGITGLGKRRDDLVIFKRLSIQKLVGDSEDNYRIVQIANGQGCLAPDSVKVIRDTVYWLDHNGLWSLGSDDVPRNVSDDKVKPWFTTDTYFNRSQFTTAFAEYDPITDAYKLFLCSAGSTTIDRWVELDRQTGNWFGPHKTAAITPSCAAVATDSNGNPRLVVGASDGKIYAPTPGNYSDGSSSAIDFDVKGKFHAGDGPDFTQIWLQMSVFTKRESGGTLSVTPFLGDLTASAGTTQSHDLTLERERMGRLGVGRLCQLRFQQATAGQGVELYGYELPYVVRGRR